MIRKMSSRKQRKCSKWKWYELIIILKSIYKLDWCRRDNLISWKYKIHNPCGLIPDSFFWMKENSVIFSKNYYKNWIEQNSFFCYENQCENKDTLKDFAPLGIKSKILYLWAKKWSLWIFIKFEQKTIEIHVIFLFQSKYSVFFSFVNFPCTFQREKKILEMDRKKSNMNVNFGN